MQRDKVAAHAPVRRSGGPSCVSWAPGPHAWHLAPGSGPLSEGMNDGFLPGGRDRLLPSLQADVLRGSGLLWAAAGSVGPAGTQAAWRNSEPSGLLGDVVRSGNLGIVCGSPHRSRSQQLVTARARCSRPLPQ